MSNESEVLEDGELKALRRTCRRMFACEGPGHILIEVSNIDQLEILVLEINQLREKSPKTNPDFELKTASDGSQLETLDRYFFDMQLLTEKKGCQRITIVMESDFSAALQLPDDSFLGQAARDVMIARSGSGHFIF